VSICQIKSIVHRVVTTKCGATTNMQSATGWTSDVTCPRCLAGVNGPSEADEYAASFASIAPLTTKPGEP
jgi:hypothetical protein